MFNLRKWIMVQSKYTPDITRENVSPSYLENIQNKTEHYLKLKLTNYAAFYLETFLQCCQKSLSTGADIQSSDGCIPPLGGLFQSLSPTPDSVCSLIQTLEAAEGLEEAEFLHPRWEFRNCTLDLCQTCSRHKGLLDSASVHGFLSFSLSF